jgi:hypothetical protein
MLDRYGVPFFYELPTLVYDRGRYRVWHPDFTLPRYNALVIEYAGMMDLPEYAEGIHHKRKTYEANGIAAILIEPQDLAGPAWPDKLFERIVCAGEQATGCRSTGIVDVATAERTLRRYPFLISSDL